MLPEETIKNIFHRYIKKFGYDEKRLSDLFEEFVINKNKFDEIVRDVLSDLKQFNNIVESLPRICPIEKVINYDYDSDKYWENFIEEVNCRIDLHNEEFYKTSHLRDDYAAEVQLLQHPEIYKYSVWVVANFGEKDNKYIDAFIREHNREKNSFLKICVNN